MTGVISTGGQGPDYPFVAHLLRNRDILIAADSGLDRLLEWKILPELVVGDGDSFSDQARSAAPGLNWSAADRHKDFSDTELAIMSCLDRGAGQIILLGGGEGRLDHLLGILELLRRYPAICQWWTAREKITVMTPGSFRTVHRPGAELSVFPLDGTGGKITTRGLVWNLDRVDFSSSMSLSNRPAGTEVEWTVIEGRFLLMELYE